MQSNSYIFIKNTGNKSALHKNKIPYITDLVTKSKCYTKSTSIKNKMPDVLNLIQN